MKTKPISIRFDADDLILAQNLSKIYKPQALVDTLISEYVKHLKGEKISLPKDFMVATNVVIVKENGKTEQIVFDKNGEDLMERKKDLSEKKVDLREPPKFKHYDYSAMPSNLTYSGREAWKKKARLEQDKQ